MSTRKLTSADIKNISFWNNAIEKKKRIKAFILTESAKVTAKVIDSFPKF